MWRTAILFFSCLGLTLMAVHPPATAESIRLHRNDGAGLLQVNITPAKPFKSRETLAG